ncbi:MAG: radical SAM family heme chaperone HemW [Chromatiaceae bacterium]|jgi:oxygen-independent coproporphyrinogen-3 oxidase
MSVSEAMSQAPASDAVPEVPPIPVSLYVHIPWCVSKCPYCDFNSHALHAPVDQDAYVDALLRDLDFEVARRPLPEIGSVFIGGGTPSLFSGAAIGRLLEGAAQRLRLARGAEITLEANPGAAEAAHFSEYRAAGVNRLSIGVQSLDDARLQALGRIHSASEAIDAFRLARDAGFDNINLDMMYGLPAQTTAGMLADLRALLALQPEHVSWYELTLEPNTRFHHRPPPLPDEDQRVEMMERGQAVLAAHGYRQYEISAYARDDRLCRHNLNYWRFGDYLGIGAGAHGKLTMPHYRVQRRSKQRQPAAYLGSAAQGALSSERRVGDDELPVEFMLNALRLSVGVAADLFAQRTGLGTAALSGPLLQARRLGLMVDDPSRLEATPRGRRYLNDLLALFEPDAEKAG